MSPIAYTPPVSEFLTPDEKAEWAEKKYQFFIVGASEGSSKYGHAFTYKLQRTIDKKSGEVETKLLSIVRNPRRQEEFDWMKDIFAQNPNAEIGPMTLGRVPTEQGNDAWVFNAAE
jgi:hypothetical protein